jgi:aldehyde dehydrogenase (NAD+)
MSTLFYTVLLTNDGSESISKLYLYSPMSILETLERQRKFFTSGKTRDVEFRLGKLRELKQAIKKYELQIIEALAADLAKSEFEAYETEIGNSYQELNFALKHLRSWVKPEKVPTPLTILPSRSYIYKEPRGTSLIIGPWNFPFQLNVIPLLGSIAAGNTSIIKPSEVAPGTSRILAELIAKTFSDEYIAVFQGDAQVAKELLTQKFDTIFFTGGTRIGREVAEQAARNLTPTILELGGKSPCIVDVNTNMQITARRIVWGKFLNAGQTCIAPDYVLVHRSEKSSLLTKMKEQILQLFGTDPSKSTDYPRIINERHFDRLVSLIKGNIFEGGNYDRGTRYIAPTILQDVDFEHASMNDEIFGPVLPVMEYDTLDEGIQLINKHSHPLALYLFTNNKDTEEKIINSISFGTGCINDCLVQFQNPNLPFGGVGTSGIGSYHGKNSFDAFSHRKSIVKSTPSLDLPLRYPPYRQRIKLLRKVMK